MRASGQFAAALCAIAIAAALAGASGANAAFPGRDGNIIFEQVLGLRYDPATDSFALASASPDGRTVTQLRYCHGGLGTPTNCCPPPTALGPSSYCPGARPAVSPDGRRLFGAWGAGFGNYGAALSFSNVDGSNLDVVDPSVTEIDASWSPDGRRVVFSRLRDPTGYNSATDLWLLNADGTRLRRLTYRGGAQPSWSVDGEIAFVRAGNLYLMRPDGRGLRRLTRRGGRQPDFSPDGRHLAFIRDTTQGDPNLYTVGRDGHGLRQLTRAGAVTPAWSPSGRTIAFVRNGIVLIPARGGRPRRIVVDGLSGAPWRLAWQPLPAALTRSR